jgi:hypothetical protein
VRDWLQAWNTSLNCRLGLNRYHQWIVSILPGGLTTEELAALPSLSDQEDVLQGSFGMDGLDDEAITRATVYTYLVPSQSSTYGGSETYRDRIAEEDSGNKIGATLNLPFLASTPQVSGPLPTQLDAPAEDVAKRWIAFRTGATIYRVTFEAGLCAYDAVDVGGLFRLTHFAGTTASGWTNRILWCEKVALDIDQRKVTITALDVTHAYEGARTLEEIIGPALPAPGDPPVTPPTDPPAIEGESPSAPSGASGGLVDATTGSAYYGNAGTTSYYKIVAVFDNGEESKPAIIGPFTTDGDGGSNVRKRAHMIWTAYPTGATTGKAGGTVTPTAMRIYRASNAGFTGAVQKCDLTKYPLPEAPGNLRCWQKTGSGTDYDYEVSQFYYLVGEGAKAGPVTVNSGATPDVWLDWWEDAAVDQVDRAGVFEQAVYRDGGHMDDGRMGGYHDNGDDSPSGGSPFPSVTPGVDLPLAATSFYDQWPGKQDASNNPWVTV